MLRGYFFRLVFVSNCCQIESQCAAGQLNIKNLNLFRSRQTWNFSLISNFLQNHSQKTSEKILRLYTQSVSNCFSHCPFFTKLKHSSFHFLVKLWFPSCQGDTSLQTIYCRHKMYLMTLNWKKWRKMDEWMAKQCRLLQKHVILSQ